MTVAGGLTLGSAGVAAAQTYAAAPKVAMKPYPPRPFDPYALVFLGSFADDPFDALTGLAREGELLGGGLPGVDGRGSGGRGAGGGGADGRGGRGADGVDQVVEPVVAGVVPAEQVQVAEPETSTNNNCPNGNCNNNGPMWWGSPGWNNTGPGAWTTNETKNEPSQPVVAPVGAGGNGGVVPVQNAVQSADGAPAGVAGAPGENLSEEEPEEEPEEGIEEESSDEGAPAGMGPEETMGGGGPAPAAAAEGPQLPFTGAPMGIAAAGAGLLAVALGCTLLSARRRRSTDAK
ncbi:hypothetical protein [Microbispora catharanthi]|uniref:Gram-positive cocci surface proteins LPxTG domain-containing protein n=1 Tax=Microbispora catharanthi TaxID=1712871 RepID=A0A5N6C397_9ACTN|nr:hypothetical protein [Microbispora catharanthi]KAB8187256.1 hypothetical protein FH610_004880 [Microbispora catharanthi]